jgi:hypothetical protein
MRVPSPLLPPLAAVVLLAAATAASAEPHTRTGVFAGFGLGLESFSWTERDGDRAVEGSGSLNARVGYALKPHLLLGAEFWGWAKEYEIQLTEGTVPVDVRLTATTVAVTYCPGGAGFFLRLGAGLAYGSIETTPPSTVAVAAVSEGKAGLAIAFAPGYEWRITSRFALGAQGDVVYLGLGGPLEDAFGYGVNAQFNWYW